MSIEDQDFETPRSISLENGKYGITETSDGLLEFRRYGEPWPAAQAAFQHAKLIYAMFHTIHCLSKALQNAQR